MATSGSASFWFPGALNCKINFSWSVKSQNGMESEISWRAYISTTHSSYFYSSLSLCSLYLRVDGRDVSGFGGSHHLNLGSAQVGSGTFTVTRSTATNQATPSISIVADGSGYYYEQGASSSTSYSYRNSSLGSSTIYVSSTTPYGVGALITNVNWLNDDEDPVIHYTYDKGSSVTSAAVEFRIAFNGSTIQYKAAPDLSGTYTMELTPADRQNLYTLLDSGKTATVKFVARTTEVVNGETMYIETSFSKTFDFVEYEPFITPTIYDTNPATIALTGNANHLIRYMSSAYYRMDVKLRKGGKSLIGCYIQNGGLIEEGFLEGTFNNPTSNIFYFSATDNRGYTGTTSYSLDMFWGEFINYIKLTTSIKCTPISADGELGITLTGKYFNANFGVAQNQLQLQYAVHEQGAAWDWSTAQTITPTMTDNSTYSYAFQVDGLDYTKQYVVEVRVADLLMSYEASVTAVARPVFYWGADTFVFNVPVTVSDDIIINGQSLLQILRSGGLIT